jgi:hypothetical protein
VNKPFGDEERGYQLHDRPVTILKDMAQVLDRNVHPGYRGGYDTEYGLTGTEVMHGDIPHVLVDAESG